MSKPVTVNVDINTTNRLYKDPPKEGDLFKVTEVGYEADSLWGSRITLVLQSAADEKEQLKNLRELYYEEHCPLCDTPSYPMVRSALFRCTKCHKIYEKTFNWPADTVIYGEEEDNES